MKTFIFSLLLLASNIFCNANELSGIHSQNEDSKKMHWYSLEIEKYTNSYKAYYNSDIKIYANNVKDNVKLYNPLENSNNGVIAMQCNIRVSNPDYDKNNLFNHLRQWMVSKYKNWKDNIKIDEEKNAVHTTDVVRFNDIVKYSNIVEDYRVSIESDIIFHFVNDSTITLVIMVPHYILDVYGTNSTSYSSARNTKKYSAKYSIVETFPYNSKSTNKKSFSMALVNSYLTLYKFTQDCIQDLNTNFAVDKEHIARRKYVADDKLLYSKYGEPTNVLKFGEKDINKEIRVYEKAQKIILLGKEMNFKDIVGCFVDDNPTVIKGNTTTMGGSVGVFFFSVGESRTYRAPDKTIHSYVVNIESDNLASPLIRISTGNDAERARNIESIMRIIMKRNQSATATKNSTQKKRTR